MIFIVTICSNVKEGIIPSCRNCSYYNWSTKRCQSYCGVNQICDGYRCVCSPGYQYMNFKCDKCPDGQHWNGRSCISCGERQTWNGAQCVCPSGQKLKASS